MPSMEQRVRTRMAGTAQGAMDGAAIALLYAAGQRPDMRQVAALMDAPGSGMAARISHRPAPREGWAEMLVNGLAFDLRGLAPAEPARAAAARHVYGFEEQRAIEGLEAVELAPSPHIAAGGRLAPVVRAMVALAANLALHSRAEAVTWQPAQTVMAPHYFSRVVLNWLSGGPFPALGLTALVPAQDGSVTSQGLSHFIGQEMQLEAGLGMSPAESVNLAIPAVDYLVRNGPLEATATIEAGALTLLAEPSHAGRRVWVSRQHA